MTKLTKHVSVGCGDIPKKTILDKMQNENYMLQEQWHVSCGGWNGYSKNVSSVLGCSGSMFQMKSKLTQRSAPKDGCQLVLYVIVM